MNIIRLLENLIIGFIEFDPISKITHVTNTRETIVLNGIYDFTKILYLKIFLDTDLKIILLEHKIIMLHKIIM